MFCLYIRLQLINQKKNEPLAVWAILGGGCFALLTIFFFCLYIVHTMLHALHGAGSSPYPCESQCFFRGDSPRSHRWHSILQDSLSAYLFGVTC